MWRPLNNNRGVALIVVILMISIIYAVTLELNRTSRASVYESANLADHVKIHYMAKSGFNCGVALLLEDKNIFDGLNENWAVPEVVAAKSAGLFEDERLQITITDESGKISLNKLVNGNAYNQDIRDLLVRLLSQPEFGLDSQKVNQIVDAIKDWIDSDDNMTTGGGAESGYFINSNKSYTAKNKPLDCIDEILMISRLARELYYGTKETPGIGSYLTVYGDGKININTASVPVLKALFKDVSPDVLVQMDAYRKTEGVDLSDPSWFKKIPSMENININMGLITTKSDYFEISAVGRFNNMTSRATGVVKRQADRKTVTLLSWRSE
jgi:general secretion pathway protein K